MAFMLLMVPSGAVTSDKNPRTSESAEAIVDTMKTESVSETPDTLQWFMAEGDVEYQTASKLVRDHLDNVYKNTVIVVRPRNFMVTF